MKSKTEIMNAISLINERNLIGAIQYYSHKERKDIKPSTSGCNFSHKDARYVLINETLLTCAVRLDELKSTLNPKKLSRTLLYEYLRQNDIYYDKVEFNIFYNYLQSSRSFTDKLYNLHLYICSDLKGSSHDDILYTGSKWLYIRDNLDQYMLELKERLEVA